YLNGHPNIVSRLNTLRDEGCAVSVISLAELYEGVYNSSNPAGNERASRSGQFKPSSYGRSNTLAACRGRML
ncbi:MAG TPA: type II toxin-antitoxin system VapC family toxin, partial [Nitrospira sp.]|nr:type II toxin-antitoxin system VapC family toxin [Nitrospira sp.]